MLFWAIHSVLRVYFGMTTLHCLPKIYISLSVNLPVYIPKRYGQSKTSLCPFCARTATRKNSKGIDVCAHHVKQVLEETRCICGSWLEQRTGKFGPYFNCIKCGNINFKRAMEMGAARASEAKTRLPETRASTPKETIITTNDADYFD